ncbi:NADH dehydrogenase Fe-S protein subunit 6 ndufs6 [Tyrophagus putrescentiae]|nr:NADH dehydrogenase Fe-S protein subunit 6 ndufs6 [Tyrophagus putrescentiae]
MISRLQCLKQVSRVALASRASASTSSGSSAPGASTTAVSKSDEFQDIETHTGQVFEKNDYRLARFVGKTKKFLKSYLIYLLTSRTQVNPRWAIKLVDEIPPTPVADRFVSCNGGGGPLGHPKVFINLDAPGNHACGYCGLRFFQEKSDHHH